MTPVHRWARYGQTYSPYTPFLLANTQRPRDTHRTAKPSLRAAGNCRYNICSFLDHIPNFSLDFKSNGTSGSLLHLQHHPHLLLPTITSSRCDVDKKGVNSEKNIVSADILSPSLPIPPRLLKWGVCVCLHICFLAFMLSVLGVCCLRYESYFDFSRISILGPPHLPQVTPTGSSTLWKQGK